MLTKLTKLAKFNYCSMNHSEYSKCGHTEESKGPFTATQLNSTQLDV